MKKYIILLAAAAFVAIACSKEQPIDDTTTDDQTVETPANAGKVTLTATMPDFIDDASKASINGSTGAFGWEDDDRISVKYYLSTDHSVTQNFTFHCTNPSTGLFESESAITEGYVIASDAAVVAEYPVRNPEYDYYYDYRTFAGDPGKTFIMEATVDAEGKLAFVHKSALVKLTIKNVPSFTYAIYVGTGESNADLTQLEYLSFSSNQESQTYYIPVRPTSSEAKMHIKVSDSTWNWFVDKKSGIANQIQAGHLYVLPELTIGRVMFFNDSDNRAKYVKLISNDNTNYDKSELNDLTGGVKYRIVPSTSWTAEGNQVTVELYGSDTNAGAFTSTKVFLYRNFDFTVGASSLSSSYRIYIEKNKTGESKYNYSDCWAFLENKDDSSDQPPGAWGGTKMNMINDDLFYIDVPASAYGKNYYLSSHVNQNTEGDWHPKTYDNERLKITLNRDIKTTIYAWSNGLNFSYGNTWDTSWDWQ